MTLEPGDSALERIIAEITSLIAMTGDSRLVRLQREAVAMRSEAQIAHMERVQGLERRFRIAGR